MSVPTPPFRPRPSETYLTPAPQPAGGELNLHKASKLLEYGIVGEHRPVDELIDHLLNCLDAKWLELALDAGPCKHAGPARATIVEGRASLDQLKSVKDRSKRLIKSASLPEERLAGIAGYLLAVAAGIVHHKTLIASRPATELRPVLLDLATATMEPWSAILGKAAFSLDEMKIEPNGSGSE